MMKKLQAILCASLLTLPVVHANVSLSSQSQKMLENLNSVGRPTATIETERAISVDLQEYFANEASRTVVNTNSDAAKPMELTSLAPAKLSEKPTGSATFASSLPMVRRTAATTRAAAIKTGSYIARDNSIDGKVYGSVLTVTGSGSDFSVNNIFGTGYPVDMTMDATSGKVTIKAQKLFHYNDTYGDIWMVPLYIDNNKISYNLGNIEGSVDEAGNITLNAWGLIIIEGDKQGAVFGAFASSLWRTPNATVQGFDYRLQKDTTYSALIEQTGENAVTIYNMCGANCEVLTGRVTPQRTLQISSQLIYTNALYGPFYLYPINWDTKKVDTDNPVIGTAAANGNISIPGWVISARISPSQYIGYGMKDAVISGDFTITYPAAPTMNFDGAGTADSPYLIKTPADMLTFSSLVQAGQTFAGVSFALGSNLDMSSLNAADYLPVGTATTPFQGTFDGNGHTISKLIIRGEGFPYVGLFGYIGTKGTVKNVTIDQTIVTGSGSYMGGIAGYNEGAITNCAITRSQLTSTGMLLGGMAGISYGPITACSYSGSLNGVGSVAGIMGQGACKIAGCHVSANITLSGYYSTACRDAAGIAGVISGENSLISDCYVTGTIQDTYGYGATGGLVGRIVSKAAIENSFNVAMISVKRASNDDKYNIYAGGVVGYASEATITNCFNAGLLMQTSGSYASEMIAGVCGYLGVSYVSGTNIDGTQLKNASIFTNCYSSGQVMTSSTNPKKGLYGDTFLLNGYTGAHPEDVCFVNCHYDRQVSMIGEDKYGRPTSYFTSGLPEGYSANIWNAATGYYPVLKSNAATQASAIASSPLLLRAGQTAAKVKVGFSINPATDVTWGIYSAEGPVKDSDALSMSGNEFTVKNIYSTSLIEAVTADGWAMKAYYLDVVPKLFDGEGTAEDPYQIKSVADFITLHQAVAQHRQPHEGDYFAMTGDIDFNYTTEFQGVGYDAPTSTFGGVFDGRNHSIKRLKIESCAYNENGEALNTNSGSKYYNGLFGTLSATGTIKNINIAADCQLNYYTYSGNIAGVNYGRIINCRNYADVTGWNSYIGGIAGVCSGDSAVVSGCYNSGKIISRYSIAGGIAGYLFTGARVELSQNDGIVMQHPESTTRVNTLGGIVGLNYGSVDRCVNSALVTADYAIGGIVGKNYSTYNQGNVTNCIVTGQVISLSETSERGGIIGNLMSKTTVNNNYYDSSVNVNGAASNAGDKGVAGLSTSQLVSGSTLNGLSTDDFAFTAGAYPVLKAYTEENASKALSRIYAAFAEGQVRTNILTSVPLSKAEGIAYSLTNNTAFSISNNTLNVIVPTDMKVATDTLTATLNGYSKTFILSSIPAILKGDGTEQSPYLLETAADWNKLADFMTESKMEYEGYHFRVVNDLDFQGDSIRLLAVNGVSFQGTFDGNNHTVKNFVYGNTNSVSTPTRWTGPNFYMGKNIGLFGTVGNFGTVKNLISDGNFSAVSLIGGIAGEVYGTLDNCVHKGTIANTSGSGCSGIANRVWETGKIINCVNLGSVTSKTTYASGIVYEIKADGLVENCYNRGKVRSTTTGAFGIAYNNLGIIRNCGNEAELASLGATSGTACGICYTVGINGILDGCYNTANLNYAGKAGTVYGICNNTTSKGTGYIRNCYNTGDLSGKTYVAGICNKVYVNVDSCYNTGNILCEGTSYGNGLFSTISYTADYPIVVSNCYNTGDVTTGAASSGGICNTADKYTVIRDCYNMGNIISTNAGLCTAGLVAKSNALIERCFNTGKVISAGNAVGGIAGYVAASETASPGRVFNCFNMGDITSTYTGTSTNGNAGGLVGYLSTGAPIVRDCYNVGAVTSGNRVGGLIGGMFNNTGIVENCYNAGKVNVTTDGGTWSATIYTNSAGVTINCNNIYYDATVNPGTETRNFAGSAKTTAELAAMDMGDAYTALSTGGYPVLKAFAGIEASDISSALILLSAPDTELTNITSQFSLVGPTNAVWNVDNTSALQIDGNTARPLTKGTVCLTVTVPNSNCTKSFMLTLNPDNTTGVEDTFAGKTVDRVTYIDMQGRQVANPVAGNVYIVRTIYTDGTMNVAKVLAQD